MGNLVQKALVYVVMQFIVHFFVGHIHVSTMAQGTEVNMTYFNKPKTKGPSPPHSPIQKCVEVHPHHLPCIPKGTAPLNF